MKMHQLIAAVALATFATASTAEILHDIRPLDRLADIKAKYPNATFTVVKAAWVTETDGFYSMKGEGFPGTLMLKFSDLRSLYRNNALQLSAEEQSTPYGRALLELASASNDDALTIDWVRWIPATAIPMARFRTKYGEPEECDFTDQSMQPFCAWPSRGLQVNLSDDQKLVYSVEGNFTRPELRKAYRAKSLPLPEYLADSSLDVKPRRPTQAVRGTSK